MLNKLVLFLLVVFGTRKRKKRTWLQSLSTLTNWQAKLVFKEELSKNWWSISKNLYCQGIIRRGFLGGVLSAVRIWRMSRSCFHLPQLVLVPRMLFRTWAISCGEHSDTASPLCAFLLRMFEG